MKGKKGLICVILCTFTLSLVLNSTRAPPIYPLVATVGTDKFSYFLREIVEISGAVTYDDGGGPQPVDRGLIGIQVEDPVVKFLVRTVPTGTGEMINGPVEITSFRLSNDDGDTETEFERGEEAHFWVTVKNTGEHVPQDILVAISFVDSTLIPIGFDSIMTSVDPGGTLIWTSKITIPLWASVGNTQVYANALSNWPENDGYPHCPEKPSNFTIMESAYSDPPTNTVPGQPVENGSYSLNFRLSPEPRQGFYRSYVCAQYEGFTSEEALVTFRVDYTPAPPIAAFTAEPPIAAPNYPINFDGSFSSPENTFANDSITSYEWNFGDTETATGQTVTHNYTAFGDYTVTLNVTDEEGFWNTTSKLVSIAEIHDIALTSMIMLGGAEPWLGTDYVGVYSDWNATMTVEVMNKGTFAETFTVTAYYDSTQIATGTVSNLGPLEETSLDLTWETTGMRGYWDWPYLNYAMHAEGEVVPGEVATGDNNVDFPWDVQIWALCDADGDGDVDIFDIVVVAAAYGQSESQAMWTPYADVAPDYGVIDIFDIVTAISVYGEIYRTS